MESQRGEVEPINQLPASSSAMRSRAAASSSSNSLDAGLLLVDDGLGAPIEDWIYNEPQQRQRGNISQSLHPLLMRCRHQSRTCTQPSPLWAVPIPWV